MLIPPTREALQLLLIEDDPDDAELVRCDLQEIAAGQFGLTHVVRLGTGLERLGAGPFDAVLLDLMLPDGEGLDAVEQVCARAPDIPIVVMTGLNDQELGVEAVRKGAQDYLVKGQADGALLVRSLRYAIERKRAQRAVREEARVSAAVVRAGEQLISCLDTPVLLDRLCETATQVLECDCSQTFLFQERDACYLPVAAFGGSPEAWEELRVLRFPAADEAELLSRLESDGLAPIGSAPPGDRLEAVLHQHFGIAEGLYMALRRGGQICGIQTAGYRDVSRSFSAQQHRVARGVAHLASLVLEHTRLLEELKQANRLKSDFVATMSHELRTPLNVIMGYHELLLDGVFGPLPEDEGNAIRRAHKSARHLADLIAATLDLSRLDADQLPLQLATVSLADIVARVENETRDTLAKSQVVIAWDVSHGVSRIYTDPTKLAVVLKNLIDNAIKFTREGQVTVTFEPINDGLQIRVSDTGIGIDTDVMPIIFEPFRQGDSSMTRAYGGLGLGLYVVRQLLRLLKGAIRVESTPGKGSTFELWVPVQPVQYGKADGV